MMRVLLTWLVTLVFAMLLAPATSQAQVVTADTLVTATDSSVQENSSQYVDSIRHRRIRRTILHSTFIPGWGQINNKQFWKVPLVAAAITIPAIIFFDNLSTYKELKQAYIYRLDTIASNDALIPEQYQVLSNNSIKYYRDAYRQNVDYSVLAFIIAWGLNVVDAAVFANLKDFDVSDDLSLKIKPELRLNGQAGVGMVLTFKNTKKQPFSYN